MEEEKLEKDLSYIPFNGYHTDSVSISILMHPKDFRFYDAFLDLDQWKNVTNYYTSDGVYVIGNYKEQYGMGGNEYPLILIKRTK